MSNNDFKEGKNCLNCGAEVKAESKFCRVCGTIIKNQKTEGAVNPIKEDTSEIKKNINKKNNFLKSLIFLFIIIIVGGVTFLIWNNLNSTNKSVTMDSLEKVNTGDKENINQENSASNIGNGGIVSQKEDLIYYCNDDNSKIYNTNDGTRRLLEGQQELKNNSNLQKNPIYIKEWNTRASSELLGDHGINHYSNLVLDNKLDTAWVEGVSGNGIGEWILLVSNANQRVSGIEIVGGYTKSEKLYYANNRLKTIEISFSDGTSIVKELSDDILDYQRIGFDSKITTKFIKIKIIEVYKGNKYQDACISEIRVF